MSCIERGFVCLQQHQPESRFRIQLTRKSLPPSPNSTSGHKAPHFDYGSVVFRRHRRGLQQVSLRDARHACARIGDGRLNATQLFCAQPPPSWDLSIFPVGHIMSEQAGSSNGPSNGNINPTPSRAVPSLAKKQSDVTRLGTQKLKFVPTLPARRKKE